MTQPLNPITTRGSLVPTSRKAGAPATAGSLTALVTPMAHISGRIAPIYNMRPSAHQTNEQSAHGPCRITQRTGSGGPKTRTI